MFGTGVSAAAAEVGEEACKEDEEDAASTAVEIGEVDTRDAVEGRDDVGIAVAVVAAGRGAETGAEMEPFGWLTNEDTEAEVDGDWSVVEEEAEEEEEEEEAEKEADDAGDNDGAETTAAAEEREGERAEAADAHAEEEEDGEGIDRAPVANALL